MSSSDFAAAERFRLFNLLVETVEDYTLFTLDLGGRIRDWNGGGERILGFTEAEAVGQSAAILFLPEDQTREVPEQEQQTALAQSRVESERWYVRKDGSRFFARSATTLLRNEAGQPEGFAVVLRNLTSNGQAEVTLAARERVFGILLKLSEAARNLTAEEDIVREACRLVKEEIGAVSSSYGFVYPEEDRVLVVADVCDSNAGVPCIEGEWPLSGFGPELIALHERGEPVVIEDTALHPATAAFQKNAFDVMHTRSLVGIPLVREGRFVAYFSIHDNHPRHYTEMEVGLLRDVAIWVWEAVQRLRAEAEHRASEDRYRSLFEAIDEGFCTIEVLFDENNRPVDYRFLEINPAFEGQTGMRQAVGRRVRELAPDLENHWFEIYGKIALTGEPARFINEARALGDRWYDVYAFKIGGEQSRKVAILFRDISAQKAAEQEVTALNVRLQRAMTETHHRIKNNLQVIAALAEMQTEGGDFVPVSALDRVGQHVRSLATIHDLLTHQSKETANGANSVQAEALLARLVPLLQSTASGRSIHIHNDDVRLTTRQATAVSVLINELVSNAVKHTTGDIEITFTVTEQRSDGPERRRYQRAKLVVCDQGAGFPDGFDPDRAAHTGLELIQMLTRHDLQGESRFANRPEGGACVTIIFPLTPDP